MSRLPSAPYVLLPGCSAALSGLLHCMRKSDRQRELVTAGHRHEHP
jgi:hypothetical protein